MLTEHDFDRIISCVRGEWGTAELLEKQSLRVSVWKVSYKAWEFIYPRGQRKKKPKYF